MFGKKKIQKAYDLGYAQGQVDRSKEVGELWNAFVERMQENFDKSSRDMNDVEVESMLNLATLNGQPVAGTESPSQHTHSH